jgi:hypothetical protein
MPQMIDLTVTVSLKGNLKVMPQITYNRHEDSPGPFGFKVAAFPIKIERASAGWVRAVAILENYK